MEGFTYHDIFQTKGIEYLIIIAFLLSLIPFWRLVNKQVKFGLIIQKSLGALTPAILKISKGVYYNRNHTWAFLNKSGVAEVGIDDWLMHVAGNAHLELLRKPGEAVQKGDLLTQIKMNEKVLHIFSPLSGEILRTNLVKEANVAEVEQISQQWMYQIKPMNWKWETRSCIIGEESQRWFRNETQRFKDFVAVSLGANSPLTSMIIMQDGGEIREQSLGELPASVWSDFQAEFLDKSS